MQAPARQLRLGNLDVEGLARVDLPEWPAELLIATPGFASATVAPEDFLWDLGPAVVELEPLEGEPK